MSYTKGKWVIDDSNVKSSIKCGKKHIAMVNYCKSKNKSECIELNEHYSNAALISAAPELFQTLNTINSWLKTEKLKCPHNKMIKSAIKKATENKTKTNKDEIGIYYNRPLPKKLLENYGELTVLNRIKNSNFLPKNKYVYVRILYAVDVTEYVDFCSVPMWGLETAWDAYNLVLETELRSSNIPPFEIGICIDDEKDPIWSSAKDECNNIRKKMRKISKSKFKEITDNRTKEIINICHVLYKAYYDNFNAT